MMIVVVALHLIQVFLYGADKKPREATWMVGVGLLLLTLGYGSSEAASPFPIVSRACASVFRLLSGPL